VGGETEVLTPQLHPPTFFYYKLQPVLNPVSYSLCVQYLQYFIVIYYDVALRSAYKYCCGLKLQPGGSTDSIKCRHKNCELFNEAQGPINLAFVS